MLRRDSPRVHPPVAGPALPVVPLGMWRHSNARDQRAGFEAHLRLARDTAGVLDEYRADGIDFEMHRSRPADGLRRAGEPRAPPGPPRPRPAVRPATRRCSSVTTSASTSRCCPTASTAGSSSRTNATSTPRRSSRACTSAAPRAGGADRGGRAGDRGDGRPGPRRDRRVTGLVTSTAVHEGRRLRPRRRRLDRAAVRGVRASRCRYVPARATASTSTPSGLRGATNLSDAKVAVTPLTDRLRLAGTMEFAGLDEERQRPDPGRRDPARTGRLLARLGAPARTGHSPAPASAR